MYNQFSVLTIIKIIVIVSFLPVVKMMEICIPLVI